MQIPITCTGADVLPLDALTSFQGNLKTLAPDNLEKMKELIRRNGINVPVFVWKHRKKNRVLDGHQRLKALRALAADGHEITGVPVAYIEAQDEDDARAKLLAITSQFGEFDADGYAAFIEGLDTDAAIMRLVDTEIVFRDDAPERTTTDGDDATPGTVPTVTQPGDVWQLGEHRLACIDSTIQENVDKLLEGVRVDALVTDPPYCSGGFQEAGKAAGSIGTKRKTTDGSKAKEYTPQIANDRLSSKGYQALLGKALSVWNSDMAYIFTDWRMWVYLFEVMESAGMGIRQMIVWDKGTPGMGSGWRSQHELIACGARGKVNFNGKAAVGNVIQSKRTGNPLHPAQKPVDVIAKILDVTDFAGIVADPFAGAGTTLIAAEQAGRKWYGAELTAGFCDVIVQRYVSWCSNNGREIRVLLNGQPNDDFRPMAIEETA